ncbi:YqeG family HAD IIIA-type phosphatase [uncultured Ruminococcus sp.]|uniref:YqeG family HAD IIIA-type phosphatase n=2 Tax=uncultured Ruminococcus sp. TaxID=165186 RepID=UPI0025D7A53E|nr:YqeG family HAD IIIA-type phosphatase [uncultured Ruminococcus sp.]
MMIKELFPFEYAESVFAIDYKKLYAKGYRGVIFDIDNTLVHHGDGSTPEVDALFKEIHAAGLKTLLLSNNEKSRVEMFIKNIDTLYICDADKPSPKGYLKAVKKLGLKKSQCVCVGDQIFTDILGANRAGLASILVKFIQMPDEMRIGVRRYAEYGLLWAWRRIPTLRHRIGDIYKEGAGNFWSRDILFCNISPFTYAISETKEKLKRYLHDFMGHDKFSVIRTKKKLKNLVSEHSNTLIKKGKGIDPVLQENKAVNIALACSRIDGMVIRPGEVFSFWRTVGSITEKKGYKSGRIIADNKLTPGLGGGLCNLGNTIHLLVLHSPLEVVEFHSHSDALAPDGDKRVPFSSGTSVCYNYIDYRFRNNTDQDVQLCLWCEDGKLRGELRSKKPFPYTYEIVEEDHHFSKEDGVFYRISKIYKVTKDKATGKVVDKVLVRDNHSEVMFDYDLIPKELIR